MVSLRVYAHHQILWYLGGLGAGERFEIIAGLIMDESSQDVSPNKPTESGRRMKMMRKAHTSLQLPCAKSSYMMSNL